MDEEKSETRDQTENEASQYMDSLNKLKASTVSKELYDKLKAENQTLIKSAEERPAPSSEDKKDEMTPKQKAEYRQSLIDKMAKEGITNLEYAETALAYRAAVIQDEGYDPFAGKPGTIYSPSANDAAEAEGIAEALQSLVKEADGDPEVFNAKWKAAR